MHKDHDDCRRKTIYAKLCAPGAESLRAFCLAHGVTVAAILDAAGHVLDGLIDVPVEKLRDELPALAMIVDTARQIDAERRSREPRLEPPAPNHTI